MKTTKRFKLISLLFAVICLMGLIPAQFAVAAEGLSDQQKALLSVVGVYDETKSLDAQLTKGEFAELLSKAVFFEGEGLSGYVPQKKITDVDEFSPYYEKVSAMYALGYIPLDTFGRFLPDEPITFGDAVSIMYRALGYTEKQVTTKWKSPERFASAKKLTNGVAMNATSGLSVYNAYVLIYNMLNCNITELFDSNEAVIYMSNKHHLYPVNGVVTHDGVVSDDYTTDIRPDQVIVGGVSYLNESGQHDLFGQRISGYYRYGLQDEEKVLVSVYSNNRINTVTTLHPGDIISFAGRTYRYDLGGLNFKIRNAYIPKDALIIYNEKKLTLDDPFTDDMFIPKNGRVRLYDNNGDGRTDIVRIENFDAGIVGNADANKEKIYINNSRIITLKGKDYVIEDKYGNELALEEVSKNNVVSFCESFDQTVVKVVVSKEYHTDLVVEYENEGNGIVKTESGGRYVLSEYAAANSEKPEVGGSYNFYFDAFDMLAGIVRDSESNTMAYGVIAAVAQEGTLSPETIVRMFTGAGEFVDFTCNKKVKILGQDDVITYVDQKDLYTTLTYTGGVRYKANDDGKLTYIELPLAFGQVPDYEDRLYYLIDTRLNGDREDYQAFEDSSGINIGAAAMITPETFVVHCPDNALDFDEYNLGGVSSFSDYGKYEMFVYGTDYRKKIADAVVLFLTFSEEITSEYAYTVKSVVKAWDEENECEAYKIVLLNRNGNESSYFMEADVYENEVLAIGKGVTTPIQIQPGDWIYFAAGDGYILKAICAFDYDQVVTDEKGNPVTGAIAGTELSYYSANNALSNPFYVADQGAQNAGNSKNSWKYYTGNITIFTGWVYSCEDGYIQITNQNPAYGMDLSKGLDDGVVTQIYSYNRGICTETVGNGKVNVRVMQEGDIKSYLDYGADCSRIVYAKYLWAGRGFNIIND